MAVIPSAFQTLMGGLGNMFAPAQAPQTAGTAGGIYDMARADAQRQALAQLGMGLVGAAVPQTPLMRAQALQNAFGSVGNMNTSIYNNAQARLMAQRTEREQQMAQARDRMFSQETPPEGIAADQWSKLKVLYGYDPDSASAAFGKILAGDGTADAGADTYGTVMYVTDKATGLPQAVLPKKGGGFVPIAEPGQAIDPATLAQQKAQGAATGQAAAEAVAGAPEVIAQAELNISNIDSLLGSDLIDAAVGPAIGPMKPESGLGIARNIITRGKFGQGVALIDQIDFGSFAEGIKMFEGKGALSNAEGTVARGLKARLTRAQSPEAFRSALSEFKAIVEAGKNRTELLLQINPETGKPYTSAEAKQIIPPLDEMLKSQSVKSSTRPAQQQGSAQSTSEMPPNLPTEIQDIWQYMSDEDKKLFMNGQ